MAAVAPNGYLVQAGQIDEELLRSARAQGHTALAIILDEQTDRHAFGEALLAARRWRRSTRS